MPNSGKWFLNPDPTKQAQEVIFSRKFFNSLVFGLKLDKKKKEF